MSVQPAGMGVSCTVCDPVVSMYDWTDENPTFSGNPKVNVEAGPPGVNVPSKSCCGCTAVPVTFCTRMRR